MKNPKLPCFVVAALALSGSALCLAASPPKAPMDDVPDARYEPSPAFPFGRLNPEAPPETAQFAFMVGEFDCVDQILNPADGSWQTFKAIWNASYFLNGYGIQDKYWSAQVVTSNIRVFDRKKKKWVVTYFKKPDYASGVWEGEKEDDKLVMRQEIKSPDGKSTGASRLTFYDISDEGFAWIAEAVFGDQARPSWKSSCKRRR